MTTRKRIVESGRSAAATTVLRRRRTGKAAPERGMEGKVVEMHNGEDLVLKLLRFAPAGINTFRSHKYLHISDLLGKCVRKMALSEKLGLSMPAGHLSDSMGLTFAQGNAIHDYVKDKFSKGHPEKMFGRWSCVCGKTVTEPMVRNSIPNRPCAECGKVPDTYHELELFDDDLMVVGSPDITLYMEEFEAYYTIEIKSINPDDWKEIARPKPDHVLQVLFYWYLMKKLGYSVPDQVSILYVTKGFIFKSPYKEFTFRPEESIGRLDDYIEEARQLKESRKEGGMLPDRKLCTSLSCKDAKECHVAVVCFQH